MLKEISALTAAIPIMIHFWPQMPEEARFQDLCKASVKNEIICSTMVKEGGYSNNPDDPGGETNYGISKKYHPNLDIPSLTKLQAFDIYGQYWSNAHIDRMKDIDKERIAFDAAINGSPTPEEYSKNPHETANDLLRIRELHYRHVVAKRPVMKKFFQGWMNRLKKLKAEIKQ